MEASSFRDHDVLQGPEHTADALNHLAGVSFFEALVVRVARERDPYLRESRGLILSRHGQGVVKLVILRSSPPGKAIKLPRA